MRWLGSRVVSLLDSGAEGPGFKSQPRRCLRQTFHTHCASVHQAAKLVAALLRVAWVTAGLAESNDSLPTGLWFMSPAGWLPRTGISSGTLRSVIEYGLPSTFFTVTGWGNRRGQRGRLPVKRSHRRAASMIRSRFLAPTDFALDMATRLLPRNWVLFSPRSAFLIPNDAINNRRSTHISSRCIAPLQLIGPVWTRGRCRISPPRFLAECCKRQLNQGSFVLLYFRLSTFSDLYCFCLSVFSCTVLFISISQVIGCEDRLRNDLHCVEWGVKLYSNHLQLIAIWHPIIPVSARLPSTS